MGQWDSVHQLLICESRCRRTIVSIGTIVLDYVRTVQCWRTSHPPIRMWLKDIFHTEIENSIMGQWESVDQLLIHVSQCRAKIVSIVTITQNHMTMG